MRRSTTIRWQLLFGAIVLGYCLYYAPFGINETDGGFLTGLAWQVLSGKTLYADVVYVRPPLPVWLRTAELALLPEPFAVLGERWIFYLKVALYCWLGAAVLVRGARRWQLATFAFVLSVHCYPPTAWHTVDGLLFGAAAIWSFFRVPGWPGGALAGLLLVATWLCKQSFYPMAVVGLLPLVACWRCGPAGQNRSGLRKLPEHWSRYKCKRNPTALLLGIGIGIGTFAAYLVATGLATNFWAMTTGATSSGQALQHGVLDYFRIQPLLAVPSAVLLAPVALFFVKKRNARWAFWAWALWLTVLAVSYAWSIDERRDFTVPFAQTRLLFWAAAGYALWLGWSGGGGAVRAVRLMVLLALCWCASVSWGYNLPVLFAVPWAYAALDISQKLLAAAYPNRRVGSWAAVLVLAALLGLFRWGYEWVYRDGPRAAMTEHLGDIFPALGGIRSSPETAALYRDLADLARRYGPNCTVLPAFPQANFLTRTAPPLPLDWVVAREMGAFGPAVRAAMLEARPCFFLEKNGSARFSADPELALVQWVWENGRTVEETARFRVVVLE